MRLFFGCELVSVVFFLVVFVIFVKIVFLVCFVFEVGLLGMGLFCFVVLFVLFVLFVWFFDLVFWYFLFIKDVVEGDIFIVEGWLFVN